MDYIPYTITTSLSHTMIAATMDNNIDNVDNDDHDNDKDDDNENDNEEEEENDDDDDGDYDDDGIGGNNDYDDDEDDDSVSAYHSQHSLVMNHALLQQVASHGMCPCQFPLSGSLP